MRPAADAGKAARGTIRKRILKDSKSAVVWRLDNGAARGTIRKRILKVGERPSRVAVQFRCKRHDPQEDTESKFV